MKMPEERTLLTASETGLEVFDIEGNEGFAARRLHVRDFAAQMEGMQRLAHAFVEHPETILQELVHVAVKLCRADSAGISIERQGQTDKDFYNWVATAGEYTQFLDAVLPRYPSACGICLERQRPQVFRVGQRFFDLMGIVAPVVTDGILLPWQVDETRGTIFVMAHRRAEAFDREDCRMMEMLADFAAMGVRQQRQRDKMLQQAGATAAAAMANDLAHQINNPLQSLTNILYLAAHGQNGEAAATVARQASDDLERLGLLVKRLLEVPKRSAA